MKEIAHPGDPPPARPGREGHQAASRHPGHGPAVGRLLRCGMAGLAVDLYPTVPGPSATCEKMAQVADLFQKNCAKYTGLCSSPDGAHPRLMMSHVYGWVPFNDASWPGPPGRQ